MLFTQEQIEYLSESVHLKLNGKENNNVSPFDCANPLFEHGEKLMEHCRNYIESNYMVEINDVDNLFAKLSEARARGYFGKPRAIDFQDGDQVVYKESEWIVREVDLESNLVEILSPNPSQPGMYVSPASIRLKAINETVFPVAFSVDPTKMEDAVYTLKIVGHEATEAGEKVVFGVQASNQDRAINRARSILDQLGIPFKGMIRALKMNPTLKMSMNRSAPNRVRWEKLHKELKNRLKERGSIEESFYIAIGETDKQFESIEDASKMIATSLSMLGVDPGSIEVKNGHDNKTSLKRDNGVHVADIGRRDVFGNPVPLSEGQVNKMTHEIRSTLKHLLSLMEDQEETLSTKKKTLKDAMLSHCTGSVEDIEEMSNIFGNIRHEGGDVIARGRKVFYDTHKREPEVYGMRKIENAILSEQYSSNAPIDDPSQSKRNFSTQAKLPINRPVRMQLKRKMSSSDTQADMSVVNNFSDGLKKLVSKARQVKSNPSSSSSNRMLGNILTNLYHMLMQYKDEPWNPLNTISNVRLEGMTKNELVEFLTLDANMSPEEMVFSTNGKFDKFDEADSLKLEELYPGGKWVNDVFVVPVKGEGAIAVERVKDGYFCHAERWGEGEFVENIEEISSFFGSVIQKNNLHLHEISMPRVRRFSTQFQRTQQTASSSKDNPANVDVVDELILKARQLDIRLSSLSGNRSNSSTFNRISLMIADLFDFLRQNSDQPWNPMVSQ